MKVGLLGAGYIFDAHAKALTAISGVDIVAVSDQNIRRAEQGASRYGIGRVTGSLEELLSTGVDSVHVLLPPQLHERAARQIMDCFRTHAG